MAKHFDKYKIPLHPRQLEVSSCNARFRVLVAGRRFGKTHLALAEMLKAAQKPASLIWYVGPNDGQSKRIAWERLKHLSRPFWAKRPNETELRIDTVWKSALVVKGAFHPDSLRGIGLDFAVVDEAASTNPGVWQYALRPALADRKGRALFIGTPQGRNHFYDLYEHALRDPAWAAFQFTTADGGLVDAAELASAARDLDPDSYRQELEAQFAAISPHRAYHMFDKPVHVKSVGFDGSRPLIWSIDFNVNPFCMLLMQQIDEMVHVLEEIVIKPEASTNLACDRFLARAKLYYPQTHLKPLVIKIYGDASGNQRRTSGAQTDWAIIKDFFSMWRGTYDPKFYITSANPFVRDRINCVNARFRNHAGDSRIIIDPQCRELIRDLEEVAWCTDSTGAITNDLNKSDKNRTHLSDALGYFISQVFNMKGKIGEKSDGPILCF